MSSSVELLPEYSRPPVDEVACGCQFEPLDRMRLPDYGLFRELLGKDFVTVEHALPIANEGEYPVVDSRTGLPVPRVWYLDRTESKLVQLQTDRLCFNWRKRPQAPEYLRYANISKSFKESYEALGKLASLAGLGVIQPTTLDLTYINVLVKGEAWNSLSDLDGIFKDFGWQNDTNRFLPFPTVVASRLSFPLPNEQGQLTVRISPGKRSADSQDILSFELSARGIGSDNSLEGMSAWFDVAHEWIVKGFTDLTQRGAQENLWGRTR